jgi:hypothetical protein
LADSTFNRKREVLRQGNWPEKLAAFAPAAPQIRSA